MALTLSSLLAVPNGNPSLSLEDHALYSTELFSGDLSLIDGPNQKVSSNQPLIDDTSFLANSDFWSNEWPSSCNDIPDLSLFCEPEVDPSFSMAAAPYTPSPTSADVCPLSTSPVSSPPVSSPLAPSPVLSPEEQIQSIIMYLEDDAPSSVESALTHTPLVSPTMALDTPISSPTPSPLTVPQKRSLYEEPDEPLSSKPRPKKKTPVQKKLRKKEQNKTAALRYRQRKKEELQDLEERQQVLENSNKQLRGQVNGLEAEIKYLKQLWLDVTKARAKK